MSDDRDLDSDAGLTPAATSTPAAPARWRRWFGQALPGGFEGQRYLGKWLLLSTAIGIVAGLGALAFAWAIEFVTSIALGGIVGYLPPTPLGEGNTGILAIGRPWLLPVVTTLGGLLSGIIVFSLAPEAEGHGTDSAIEAIHHKRGRVRARIPPVKLIASAITIGSGGSGGREGPAAQISAGFGSLLGQWLNLDAQDRRIAVAAGMGAGIGAIFRAPLGGAVMAAEILYIHDLEVEALIPALIASIVGYSIFGAVAGWTPIFGEQAQLTFAHPIQLVYYALLGLISGLGGLLYARSFYGMAGVFHHLGLPRWVKPAIGGLIVGLLGLVVPGALHTGYGWVQLAMGQELLALPLWVVLALPFAKILATSLSIGSGGSGGIFGPGMVIGGFLGAAFWRLTHALLPQMPLSPAPFVIIGMIALFGGIAHAPLAVMLMVAEMTGNLSLLAPAMVAVAISTALVGNTTIYRSQLPSRADSPAHRMRFSFPLLSSLLVRDAITPIAPGTPASMPAAEPPPPPGTSEGNGHGRPEHDAHVDAVPIPSIQSPPHESNAGLQPPLVGEALALTPDQPLDVVLDRLAARGLSGAPVVEEGRTIGWLHVRDVMRVYKATLERSVRRAGALTPESALFEARLGASSPLVGRTLREAGLPRNTLVVSVTREGETIFPRADTRLAVGDVVMILVDPASEPALRAFLEGAPPA